MLDPHVRHGQRRDISNLKMQSWAKEQKETDGRDPFETTDVLGGWNYCRYGSSSSLLPAVPWLCRCSTCWSCCSWLVEASWWRLLCSGRHLWRHYLISRRSDCRFFLRGTGVQSRQSPQGCWVCVCHGWLLRCWDGGSLPRWTRESQLLSRETTASRRRRWRNMQSRFRLGLRKVFVMQFDNVSSRRTTNCNNQVLRTLDGLRRHCRWARSSTTTLSCVQTTSRTVHEAVWLTCFSCTVSLLATCRDSIRCCSERTTLLRPNVKKNLKIDDFLVNLAKMASGVIFGLGTYNFAASLFALHKLYIWRMEAGH